MKIFITGGAGFIGSNIAHYYLEKGYPVVVYDNLSRAGVERNIEWLKKNHPQVIFSQSDIREFNKLNRSMRDASIVYHMASQVTVTKSVQNPMIDFEINAAGTLNLLEAARNQKKPPLVVYASTNKVYGEMADIRIKAGKKRYMYKEKGKKNGINEKQQLDFHSPYGCSKGTGDQYVLDYARIYGLQTIVFRQSCIYGNRQFGNEDQGWIAHISLKALEGNMITIFGNGKQVRDVLYIDDLIECFVKAIKNIGKTSGQAYNIGGGKENSISIIELLEILESKLQKKIKTKFADWRPGDQRIYISDTSKAKKHFGWKPETSVKEGLTKLFEWLESL